jgi:hypothetical protein
MRHTSASRTALSAFSSFASALTIRAPIKLLEVNANTVPTGSIEPIPFSPSRDIPFVTEIAEISPEEFSRLERGELAVPPGWTLEDADDVPRPRAA